MNGSYGSPPKSCRRIWRYAIIQKTVIILFVKRRLWISGISWYEKSLSDNKAYDVWIDVFPLDGLPKGEAFPDRA